MPTLRELLDDLIEKEGGYVNDPNDAGGATNFGISLRYAKSVGDGDGDGKIDFDLDGDGDVDAADIRKLTRAEAEKYYVRDFLEAPGIHKLPDSLIPQIFDCAVNHGPSRGIKFLQEIINMAGFGPIEVDGKVGPVTLRYAFIADKEMGPYLVNAVVEQRIAFYYDLCLAKPSQKKFLKGWLRRANSFLVETN